MAVIYKIKERKAEKLFEHAMELYKEAKKLKECMKELVESADDEDFNERNMGSRSSRRGNFRDDDDDDDDDVDYNERRGVPGTGRYGRSRYRG